jgi:hypothetical protein
MLAPRSAEFLRLVGIKWAVIDEVVVRLDLAAGLAVAQTWGGYMLSRDFVRFVEWRVAQPGGREQQRNAFLRLPAPFLVPELTQLLPHVVPFPFNAAAPETLRSAHAWLEGEGHPILARALADAHPDLFEAED